MKKINLIILVFSIVLILSCNKDYLNRFPESDPNSATYYTTADQLTLAINAAYNNLVYQQDGFPYQMQLEGTSDLIWQRPATDAQTIGLGQHTSNTTMIRTIWTQSYIGIGRCNALLENMIKAKSVTTAAQYSRIEGEAKFLRAYYYGTLISLYGDVPLVIKSIPTEESYLARTPKAEVLNAIFSDLDSAAAKLPLSYTGTDIGRATKTSALAFKSRIALYNAKWDVAAAASKAVIDLGYHALYPNYRNLFMYVGENSRESILAFDYKLTIRTNAAPQNNQARNSSGFSGLIPTRALADSYECTDGLTIDKSTLYSTADPFKNRDPRMRQTLLGDGDTWFGAGGITFNMTFHPDSTTCSRYTPTFAKIPNLEVTNAFSSYSGFIMKKYLDPQDMAVPNQSELAFMLIRYAEVLLNYAEAKIELNQIDASVLDAINLVRARGYGVAATQTTLYPAIKTTNQTELRAIVRRERKIELAGEGLRVFDIRRWNIAEKVMNGILFGKAMNKAIYYSLPKPALDENSSPDYTSFTSLLSVVGNFKIMDNPRVFKSHNLLWPIPQAELDVNKNPGFKQNPGY
ncbi:MAG: RagB/SusD family nutrient uptake outer membrane protein [Bacteroidetes bacterium]|nr:RagB/SusD family nutrient uptake outer membrane protein [Bacteroidota bacterium]